MSEQARFFIAIYTDEDVTVELAPALRERGFEAQSAIEAGLLNASDATQLAHATEHGMALLTCNVGHFLQLAKQSALSDQIHTGIILSSEQYSHRQFGEFLRQVLRLLNTLTADEMHNRVVYLQQFK